MYRIVLVCLTGMVAANIVQADGITTSVTCTAFGSSPITATNRCSEGTGLPFASGSASATISYYANSISTVISLGGIALDAGTIPEFNSASSVQFTAEVTGTALTAGPVRSGYIQVESPFPNASGGGYSYEGRYSYLIGGLQNTCSPAGALFTTCPFTSRLPARTLSISLGNEDELLVPVTLGEPIFFDTHANFFIENGLTT